MSSIKLEILWSPNSPNKFLTWGSEISLYQINQNSVKEDAASTQSTLNLNIVTLLFCSLCYSFSFQVFRYLQMEELPT